MTNYKKSKKSRSYQMREIWFAMLQSNRIECPSCNAKIQVVDTCDTLLECSFCEFRCKTSTYIREKVTNDLIDEMIKERIL